MSIDSRVRAVRVVRSRAPATAPWWRRLSSGGLVLAALVVGTVAVVVLVVGTTPVVDTAADPAAGDVLAALDAVPTLGLELNGRHLLEEPLQLGGEALDVLDAIGTPDTTVNDLGGPAHVWTLPRGRLTVTVWEGSTRVAGYTAASDGDGRMLVWLSGGVLLGRASLDEVLTAWGAPTRFTSTVHDDHVAAWDRCIGGFPVVVTIDQEDAVHGRAGQLDRDAAVTTVVVAFADAPHGTGPCAGSPVVVQAGRGSTG